MERVGRYAIAIATLAFAPGAVQASAPDACALAQTVRDDAVLSVPFRTHDGRIYVEAQVNEKGPFAFAVDTGASGAGRADARLVARLDLPVHGTQESSDGVATAVVNTVRLASLELGGLVRTNLDVITRDYNSRLSDEAKFDGILGRKFFEDGLLVIDYPNRQLSFTRRAGLTVGGKGVLSYARAFRVPMTVGDVATEGNLDTGANVACVVPESLFERFGGGETEAAPSGQLMNTAIDTARATLRGPVRIGAATLENVEVRVSKKYPELLVGAHALQQFTLLIDQRTQAVALCPELDEAG